MTEGSQPWPFPFYFFLCLLSTVLPSLSAFCWQRLSIFWCQPNESNKSSLMKKNANVIFDLSVQRKRCLAALSFPSLQFTIERRKEKDTFVFVWRKWWTASRAREWVRVKRETFWERGIWGKNRCCFMLNMKDRERHRQAQTWPDFFYRIQPLKDTWRPSMVTNWDKPVVTMEWWWQIQKQQIFSGA